MHRLLALLAFSALLVAFAPASAQEPFDIPSVAVSGGGLPHAVELAPADADAFRRRINQLPRLEDPPEVSGPRYVLTTSYWAFAVRLEDDEDPLDVMVRADYYPEGGVVRATLELAQSDTRDVWMVLSLRQRTILDRYIRLAEEGLIGEEPSTLAVLAAAMETEVLGVQAGDEIVPQETAQGLFAALNAANPAPHLEERDPPFLTEDGFWLIVNLTEGRTHRYYYAEGRLTEGLGTERYNASSVLDQMTSLAPVSKPAIVQDSPAGSLLWWPAVLGGGLAAIALAVWLRRRTAAF